MSLGVFSILFLFSSRLFHIGEAKGAVILSSSFSISGEYTDNLFFTEQDPKSDFSTILSPGLSMSYTSKNVELSIGYVGSAQFYAKNPQADGYFQSLSIDLDFPGLNHQIRGLEISVIEKMSYSPGLPAYSFGSDALEVEERFNQVLLEGEGIQGDRIDTFRNIAGIQLNYTWTQNFDISSSYTNIITRYSENPPEDTEANIFGFEGSYHLRLSSRTEWTASYGFSMSLDEPEDRFHQVDVGVAHQVTPLVTVDGDIGIAFVEGESPGIVLGAGISKRYKRGNLTLQYTNYVANGLGVIQGLTTRQSVIGEITQALGKTITSYLNLGYTKNKSFEQNGVDVSSYTIGAGLVRQMLSWLSGSIGYSYLRQYSENDFAKSAERNVITFTLTAGLPAWRIIK